MPKIPLLIIFLPFFAYSQTVQEIFQKEKELETIESTLTTKRNELGELKLKKIREDLKLYGYPVSPFKGEIITHSAMTLEYVEKHEQAAWVYHIISTDMMKGREGRSNDFRPDEKVSTGSAVEKDYFLTTTSSDGEIKYEGFGYDRGHLAPSADFRWNPKALSESYYYSNMSPQTAKLNREIWATIESYMRAHIYRTNNPLWVVTGGVLNDKLPRIERGVNKVSIPERYFKVVFDPKEKKGAAFLVPNINEFDKPEKYIVSIDSIEKLTGITFFPELKTATDIKLQNDATYWIPLQSKTDVHPLNAEKLPKNTFNTEQAQIWVGKNETVRICGTVVGSHLSKNGNIFLNLDKEFPNSSFSGFIKAEDVHNFSYPPEVDLNSQCICITGKVTSSQGKPSMNITREEQIIFYNP